MRHVHGVFGRRAWGAASAISFRPRNLPPLRRRLQSDPEGSLPNHVLPVRPRHARCQEEPLCYPGEPCRVPLQLIEDPDERGCYVWDLEDDED